MVSDLYSLVLVVICSSVVFYSQLFMQGWIPRPTSFWKKIVPVIRCVASRTRSAFTLKMICFLYMAISHKESLESVSKQSLRQEHENHPLNEKEGHLVCIVEKSTQQSIFELFLFDAPYIGDWWWLSSPHVIFGGASRWLSPRFMRNIKGWIALA